MKDFPKVKIHRLKERLGLIKARIEGVMIAKGPTLTFLDSHVECTTGWLEPLLSRIAENPTNVACPVIDSISDTTFQYQWVKNSIPIGGFDWKNGFKWIIPAYGEKTSIEPLHSPTMAGGLFTIDKAFFKKLGLYDPDFDIWGAENLELSFKTWMCGGTLEIIPCSHVGHIFRKKSPYKWRPGKDVVKNNLIRL
jgi:polypeptide N-acetylgalactosaminyltransferase